MKFLVALLTILLSTHFSFAQIEEQPASYSTIKYVYESTPNFVIKNKMVYADTAIFKIEFPNLKYMKVVSPKDSLRIVGKYPLNQFTPDYLKELRFIISHTFTARNFDYNVKRKRIKTTGHLFDERCKIVYSDLFGQDTNFNNPYFPQIIKIKNERFNYIPSYSSFKNRNLKLSIEWSKEYPNFGIYKSFVENNSGTYEYNNIIEVNPNLPKYVNPHNLFTNSEFGVQTIITLFNTTRLVSVDFE